MPPRKKQPVTEVIKNELNEFDKEYAKGYEEGFNVGYKTGYDEGYSEGVKKGLTMRRPYEDPDEYKRIIQVVKIE